MKDYTAKDIRNVGVFGHGGEGKTTLTEAMLFNAGLLERLGKVETARRPPTLTRRRSSAPSPSTWRSRRWSGRAAR